MLYSRINNVQKDTTHLIFGFGAEGGQVQLKQVRILSTSHMNLNISSKEKLSLKIK
jgi:hypothetical protein